MGKYLRPVLALVLGGMLMAATAQADERQANELRERANGLKEKIQRLHEEGKHDAAKQLEREVDELFAKADRVAGEGPRDQTPADALRQKLEGLYKEWIEATIGGRGDVAEDLQRKIHDMARDAGARMQELVQPQLEMMERRIAELREQGKPELADRLAEKLRETMQAHRQAQVQQRRERGPEGRPGPGPQDHAERERRMQHLRVAADNLNAIGMQDLAERLCREADEIQQSLQQPRPQGGGFPQGMLENIQNELRGLHQRLDEMNRRLDELMEIARRDHR